MFEVFPLINKDVIESFLNGERTVCASAVVITIDCIANMSNVIKEFLDGLSTKTKDHLRYRRLIIYAIKLSF